MSNYKMLAGRVLLGVAAALLLASSNIYADSFIKCGSDRSGFTVATGANLLVGDGANLKLIDGTLSYADENSIDAAITCVNARIVDTGTAFDSKITGVFNSDDSITLGNNSRLVVVDGVTPSSILVTSVEGSEAVIEGAGTPGTLSLANNAHVNFDITSSLQNGVSSGSSTQINLLNDLALKRAVSLQPKTLNGNGHTVFLGSQHTITDNITLNDVTLDFKDSLTLTGATITPGATQPIFNGNGGTLLGAGDSPGITVGTNTCTFNNLTVADSSVVNITVDNLGKLYVKNVALHSPYGALRFEPDNAVYIHDASGSYFSDGGGMKIGSSDAAYITLLKDTGDASEAFTWTLSSGDLVLNGAGHMLNLNSAQISIGANDVSFSNITLANMRNLSLARTTGAVHLSNVTLFDDGNEALTIFGAPESTTQAAASISPSNGGEWFSSDVTWNNGVSMELQRKIDLNATWTFSYDAVIAGNGNVLDVGGGTLNCGTKDLYLSDITLANMKKNSIVRSVGSNLYLSNVKIVDSSGNETLSIIGSSSSQDAAKVTPESGEFFAAEDGESRVDWENGVNMALHNRVTLERTWNFFETSYINGNGNALDVRHASAQLKVLSGKKLYLSNITIIGLSGDTTTGPITCEDDTAEVHLSNVTFALSGNWVLNKGLFFVDSQSTFITGNKVVTANALTGGTRLTITGCTLFYDTLAFPESGNIVPAKATAERVAFGHHGDSDSVGRIARVLTLDVGDIHVASTTEQLSETTFLYQDTAGGYGVQLYFDNADTSVSKAITFDGAGRSLVCADTRSDESNTLITVAENTTVTMKNITLDGMVSDTISYDDSGDDPEGSVVFGPYAVWRLNRDDALSRSYLFNSGATSTPCTLDLGGNELTIDATNNISVAANSKLLIKNGTLNVTGSCLVPVAVSAELEFENVELKLSGDTSISQFEKITFSDECRIFGAGDYTITLNQSYDGEDDRTIVIANGARLLVDNGMTLECANDGSFVFTGTKSVLELRGGIFKTSGDATTTNSGMGLVLKKGVLTIDHRSSISGNMTFGDETNPLKVVLFPGATINVTSGTVTYANIDS